MLESDRAYYEARATEEARRAEQAEDLNAAFVHRQLKSRYERIACGELPPRPRD